MSYIEHVMLLDYWVMFEVLLQQPIPLYIKQKIGWAYLSVGRGLSVHPWAFITSPFLPAEILSNSI